MESLFGLARVLQILPGQQQTKQSGGQNTCLAFGGCFVQINYSSSISMVIATELFGRPKNVKLSETASFSQ